MARPPFAPHSLAAVLWAATISLAALPAPVFAQCDSAAGPPVEIAGQVIDARARAPLQARIVVTSDADTLAALDADSSGAFATTVCRRTRVMAHFRRSGYTGDSVRVSLDSVAWRPLDVALAPARAATREAITTMPVRVSRTTVAIARRARRGGGWFIDAEEIGRLSPSRTSDLLRGRRGIALEDASGGPRVVSARAGRPRVTPNSAATAEDAPRIHSGTETCPLRIGVDGILMADQFRIDEVAVATLTAIEVYPSASAMPMEFTAVGTNKICGLVMLWTETSDAPRP